jgi:hypothetical protein
MITEHAAQFTLALDEEERAVLRSLLRESLVDTHAEKRRTEAPGYRDRVQHQEAIIRCLIDKVTTCAPE